MIQGLCLVGSVVAQPITVGTCEAQSQWERVKPIHPRRENGSSRSPQSPSELLSRLLTPSMKVLPFKYSLVALWAKPLACGFLGVHSKLKLYPGVWLISHNLVCSRLLYVVVDNEVSFSRFAGTPLCMHTTSFYAFSH